MSVILDLPFTICIWISAVVAIIYTLMGGLYSVAYTDVIQLILMFISLVRFPTSWFSKDRFCWFSLMAFHIKWVMGVD